MGACLSKVGVLGGLHPAAAPLTLSARALTRASLLLQGGTPPAAAGTAQPLSPPPPPPPANPPPPPEPAPSRAGPSSSATVLQAPREEERLQAVHALHLIGVEPKPAFDHITQLMAVCGCCRSPGAVSTAGVPMPHPGVCIGGGSRRTWMPHVGVTCIPCLSPRLDCRPCSRRRCQLSPWWQRTCTSFLERGTGPAVQPARVSSPLRC